MQHGDVWRGLDLLAHRHGLSVSGLAKLAGLDATAFNKSKRISKDGRLRWPSTESISRALAAVGVEFVDFADLVAGQSGAKMPLIRFDQVRTSESFDASGTPSGPDWEEIRFPGLEVTDGLYAVELTGSVFEPTYRSGSRLIVSRHATVRAGDRVVVKLRQGEMVIGELVRQSESRIELMQLSGEPSIRALSPADVAWMTRILWVSQ